MAAQKGHFRARHFAGVVAIPVLKEVSAKRHPRRTRQGLKAKQKHRLSKAVDQRSLSVTSLALVTTWRVQNLKENAIFGPFSLESGACGGPDKAPTAPGLVFTLSHQTVRAFRSQTRGG